MENKEGMPTRLMGFTPGVYTFQVKQSVEHVSKSGNLCRKVTMIFDDKTGTRQYSDAYFPVSKDNEGWFARAEAFFGAIGEDPINANNEELQGLTGTASFILDEFERDDGSIYYSVKADKYFAQNDKPEEPKATQQTMKEYARTAGYPTDDVPF